MSIVLGGTQTNGPDHGAQGGSQASTDGYKKNTGRPISPLTPPGLIFWCQGSRDIEVLDDFQPAVVPPRRTNALHATTFRSLGLVW